MLHEWHKWAQQIQKINHNDEEGMHEQMNWFESKIRSNIIRMAELKSWLWSLLLLLTFKIPSQIYCWNSVYQKATFERSIRKTKLGITNRTCHDLPPAGERLMEGETERGLLKCHESGAGEASLSWTENVTGLLPSWLGSLVGLKKTWPVHKTDNIVSTTDGLCFKDIVGVKEIHSASAVHSHSLL